jgi:hypothetical protein
MRSCLELAAEDGDPLAHPSQASPAAMTAAHPRPVVDLEVRQRRLWLP